MFSWASSMFPFLTTSDWGLCERTQSNNSTNKDYYGHLDANTKLQTGRKDNRPLPQKQLTNKQKSAGKKPHNDN